MKKLYANGLRLLAACALAGAYTAVDRYGDDWFQASKADASAAPAFDLPLISPAPGTNAAKTITLAALGGRPTVVNFWATWCTVCREEKPDLVALGRAHPDRILGIATLDVEADVRASERARPHGYAVAFDGDGSISQKYGVTALPATVVVSAEGRIIRRFAGKLTAANRRDIETLLQ